MQVLSIIPRIQELQFLVINATYSSQRTGLYKGKWLLQMWNSQVKLYFWKKEIRTLRIKTKKWNTLWVWHTEIASAKDTGNNQPDTSLRQTGIRTLPHAFEVAVTSYAFSVSKSIGNYQCYELPASEVMGKSCHAHIILNFSLAQWEWVQVPLKAAWVGNDRSAAVACC